MLTLLALSPRSAGSATARDLHAPTREGPKAFSHPAIEKAAAQLDGLSGFALADTLDEVALSDEFWVGLTSIIAALDSTLLAERDLTELIHDADFRLDAPAGVDPKLVARTLAATIAVAEILPSDLAVAQLVADTDLPQFAKELRAELSDPSIPAAARQIQRKALRGLAASFVLAAHDSDPTPARYSEFARFVGEGMENMLRLAVANGDAKDAVHANALLQRLGLPKVDRDALARRAEYLQTAREQLASAAQDLDGEPLRLPPDPGFQEDDA